jgi:hypothetical protein
VNLLGRVGVRGGFLLSLNLASLRELFLEPVNASFGVYELLTASEERVAAGTDFDAEVTLMGGAGAESGAASEMTFTSSYAG